jgi:hypothetical protein
MKSEGKFMIIKIEFKKKGRDFSVRTLREKWFGQDRDTRTLLESVRLSLLDFEKQVAKGVYKESTLTKYRTMEKHESAGHFILIGKLYTNITGQKGKVINHCIHVTKRGGEIWKLSREERQQIPQLQHDPESTGALIQIEFDQFLVVSGEVKLKQNWLTKICVVW